MTQKRERFRALHEADAGFIMPNPWDVGSARILTALGFEALATTSAGHAAVLGRLDGLVTQDEALEHAALLADATPLPLSADLENGYGDGPDAVAETIVLADATGLAGCSIEDWSRDDGKLYEPAAARERVAAAAEAARRSSVAMVLTARAENHIRGNPDLNDTIARLQAYQEAGADVLYAPGLRDLDEIRSVVGAVDRPVNALLLPGGPTSAALFEAGVKRISLGSALSLTAHAALVEAGQELLEKGTHDFWLRAVAAMGVVQAALDQPD
jgi:2-methylisocitrate lyase-like PEP mutase family enzyme